ncbi:hypothetical protein N7456_012303 [Penicillium angulare]|uniref:Uncharacterized protein n=1 Tax=Penicillium angulare TaxID=116970 RepID=A0A9W9EVE5_9EURO|nr:hypothetical protein N7456_012303 [Penicillium angulare]
MPRFQSHQDSPDSNPPNLLLPSLQRLKRHQNWWTGGLVVVAGTNGLQAAAALNGSEWLCDTSVVLLGSNSGRSEKPAEKHDFSLPHVLQLVDQHNVSSPQSLHTILPVQTMADLDLGPLLKVVQEEGIWTLFKVLLVLYIFNFGMFMVTTGFRYLRHGELQSPRRTSRIDPWTILLNGRRIRTIDSTRRKLATEFSVRTTRGKGRPSGADMFSFEEEEASMRTYGTCKAAQSSGDDASRLRIGVAANGGYRALVESSMAMSNRPWKKVYKNMWKEV